MIVRVTGILAEVGEGWVVLEVGGVGLQVHVPSPLLDRLPPPGQSLSLHTYLVVREDGWALYGFETLQGRTLFERLLAVNGVGPRVALALLSHLGEEGLQEAILRRDVARLQQVPGVGKKLAGRLILELQGQLAPVEGEVGPALPPAADPELEEALLALGYTAAEVQRALARARPDPGLPLEERLRRALQELAPP